MTKLEFILALKDKLSHLPQSEVAERLNFYCEMIEDRVEEGLSEQEAVAAVGSVDEIAEQIASEIPMSIPNEGQPKRKKRPPLWIILLVALGCPVWLSLLIAAAAVALALYAVAWSVIASLWAAFASLVSAAVGALGGGLVLVFGTNAAIGAAMIGAGIVLAGLSVLFFVLCKAATDGIVLLTKKTLLCIKKLFTKKEGAK